MVNYQNGKIYVLKRTTNDKTFYVGSTVNPLYKRLCDHKSAVANKQKKHLLVYKYIIKKGGKDAFYIELYKRYPCETIEELRRMEGRVIRRLTGNGIKLKNKLIAGRTVEEYRQTEECKARQKAYKKKYDKQRVRGVVTCECGVTVSKPNFAQHKKTAIHQRLIAELDDE